MNIYFLYELNMNNNIFFGKAIKIIIFKNYFIILYKNKLSNKNNI